jgi:hypothetical protein
MISLILALLIGCTAGKEDSSGADSVADSAQAAE